MGLFRPFGLSAVCVCGPLACKGGEESVCVGDPLLLLDPPL